jgi:hypothetical protein
MRRKSSSPPRANRNLLGRGLPSSPAREARRASFLVGTNLPARRYVRLPTAAHFNDPDHCRQRAGPREPSLPGTGVATLQGIADEANRRSIPTTGGRGHWQAAQVQRVLAPIP